MITEFDSDANQLEAQNSLELLTLEKIMREDDESDPKVALENLIIRINNLTPQCPKEFRSEKNMIRYLRQAVLQENWA